MKTKETQIGVESKNDVAERKNRENENGKESMGEGDEKSREAEKMNGDVKNDNMGEEAV